MAVHCAVFPRLPCDLLRISTLHRIMSAFDIVCKCSAHDDLKNFVLLPQIPALEKGIKKAQEELAKIAKAEQDQQGKLNAFQSPAAVF